jgi:hypothetical protein
MNDEELRGTLSRLLRQSHSHVGVNRALDGFPSALAGRRIDEVSYCRDADYKEIGWPDGYWPEAVEPPTEEAWHESTRRLLEATETMAAMVEDAEHDLYAKVPSAEKKHHHTLRAALILLDHNGYHAGQLIDLRRALGVWPSA